MGAKIHYLGDSNPGPRGGKLYLFECPGCGHGHCFEVGKPGWTWNGSLDKPTFQPSLLVYTEHNGRRETLCHSFVTDGNIRFLGDCKHNLKGQTVELPDWED